MKRFLPVLFLIFLPGFPGALAQGEKAEEADRAYTDCLILVQSSPTRALEVAQTWRDSGGGLPARHCVALAFSALDRFRDAALELETLADEMERGLGWSVSDLPHPNQRGLLADVYAQGGNAWLLAGDPVKGLDLFNLGLVAAERNSVPYAELLLDRAITLGEIGNYEGALKDLKELEGISKPNVDIMVLKAGALRGLDNFAEAQSELKKALRIDPKNPEAHLEQGHLYFTIGDFEAAKKSWQMYLELKPEGPVSDFIRRAIEDIDNE